MGNQWWYQEFGVECGPFSDERMRSLVDEGVVDERTPVRRRPDERWVSASIYLPLIWFEGRDAGRRSASDPAGWSPVRRDLPKPTRVASRPSNDDGVPALRGRIEKASLPPTRPAADPADAGRVMTSLLSLVCCVGGLTTWAPWAMLPGGEINGWAFSVTWPAWAIACSFLVAGVAAWVFRGRGAVLSFAVAIPAGVAIGEASWVMLRLNGVLNRYMESPAGLQAVKASGAGLSFGLPAAVLCGVLALALLAVILVKSPR